jgi:hypothetical protein
MHRHSFSETAEDCVQNLQFARSLLVGRRALVCEFKLLQCSVLGTSDSAHYTLMQLLHAA